MGLSGAGRAGQRSQDRAEGTCGEVWRPRAGEVSVEVGGLDMDSCLPNWCKAVIVAPATVAIVIRW